jgi:hypothetical protein
LEDATVKSQEDATVERIAARVVKLPSGMTQRGLRWGVWLALTVARQQVRGGRRRRQERARELLERDGVQFAPRAA